MLTCRISYRICRIFRPSWSGHGIFACFRPSRSCSRQEPSWKVHSFYVFQASWSLLKADHRTSWSYRSLTARNLFLQGLSSPSIDSQSCDEKGQEYQSTWAEHSLCLISSLSRRTWRHAGSHLSYWLSERLRWPCGSVLSLATIFQSW